MGFPIPQTGTVTEDVVDGAGNLSVSGDADILIKFRFFEGNWVPQSLTGAYGSTLAIDAQGNWTYTADNSNPTIQALDTGDTLTEVFTITENIFGPTTVTITIEGADEPPCFVRGTLISTPHGPRVVESLAEGDIVLTADSGPQVIRWIGSRRIDAHSFDEFDSVRPVRVRAGAFGPGVPSADLLMSPAHRVLMSGPAVQLYLGREEVFCATHHLIDGVNVHRENCTSVEYFHILLDGHEVLTANGCKTESFLPGPLGLAGFEDEAREEVFGLFPDLRNIATGFGPPARVIAKRHETALLVPEPGEQPAPEWLWPEQALIKKAS